MKRRFLLLTVSCLVSTLSFGQIFITELADPFDNNTARYVELFNAGDVDVDLSTGYGLQRYTNGNTEPQTTVYTLTGVIPAKGFYLVARTATAFEAAYGFAADQELGTDGPADSNGDDQIMLLDPDGNVIDMFGVAGEDGTGTCHGFEDGRAERVATVTAGNDGIWSEANWNVWGVTESLECTSHVTQSVSTTDGMFDPGQWIGYVPANTIVSFELLNAEAGEESGTLDVCVTITNPDASSATTVDISMSELSTAENGADFASISFPYTITFPAGTSDKQCLTISLTDDTDPELPDTLVLVLENVSGGESAELGTQAQFTLVIRDNDIVCLNPGDLIITEVMQNPAAVSDDNGEWFEVYNTTSSDLDLFGLEFADDATIAELFIVNRNLIIPAGGYLVFARVADPAVNGGLVPDYIYWSDPSFTLANAVDGITIQCRGTVIDAIVWDDGATFPDPTGASMSLSPDHLNATDNDDGANWAESAFTYGLGDYGTPGCSNDAACCDLTLETAVAECDAVTAGTDTYTVTIGFSNGGTSTYAIAASAGTVGGDDPTSVIEGTITVTGINEGTDLTLTVDNSNAGGSCNFVSTVASPLCFEETCADAGSVIFTEIMQNPDMVSDDLGEWFELYNTTAGDIDLVGWTVVDDDHALEEEGFTITTSLVIPAGGYLIFANNGDAATNGNLPAPDYVYEPGFPFLGNGTDGITLQCSGSVIDQVIWDDGATFPDPTGASMALLAAYMNATDNDNGANWATSVAAYGDGDLGTPGEENFPLSIEGTENDSFVFYPNPVSNGQLNIRFANDGEKNIVIYNVLGNIVSEQHVTGRELSLQLDLQSGVYFLKVTEEGNSTTNKLYIRK